MSSGTTIATNRPAPPSATASVTGAAAPAPVVPSIQLTSKPRQRFSEEDDRRIILAVSDPMYCKSKGQRQSLLGIDASWTKIAREVFGGKFKRESIRTRYRRKLHPNLKQGRWTVEEDQRLMALHSRIGGQWTTISAEMDFERNDLQCRDRYAMLIRKMKKSEAAQAGGGGGGGKKSAGVQSAKTTERKNGIITGNSRIEVDETTLSSPSSTSLSFVDSSTTATAMSVSPSSSIDSLNRMSSLSTVFNVPASPLTPLSSCSSSVMMYGAYQSGDSNSSKGAKMGAEQATATTTVATTEDEQAKSPTSPQRLVDNELIKGVSDLMILQKRAAHAVIHEQYRQLMYYRYWMMCHHQYQQQQQQQQLQFPLQQQQQLQEYPQFVQYDQTTIPVQRQQQQFPAMTGFPQMPFCPSPSQPTDVQQGQPQVHEATKPMQMQMQIHHTPAPEELEAGMITPISASSTSSSSSSQPFDVARESTNTQATTTQAISRGRGSYYYRGFKFTEGADAKLLAAINSLRYRINGGAEVDWSSIAKEEFQGLAAPSMLQRRYLRAMHPNLRHDEWTPEEDQKLLQLHANHGGQWLTISEGMNFTRSDYQCRKRFQELTGQKNSTASKKCAKRSHSNSNSSNGSGGSGDMSESDDGTSPIGINAAAAAAMSALTGEPAYKRLRCEENVDKSDLLPEGDNGVQQQQQQQQQQQVCSVIKQVLQNQPRLSM